VPNLYLSTFQSFAFILRVWHGKRVTLTWKSAGGGAAVREETAQFPEGALLMITGGDSTTGAALALLPGTVSTCEGTRCRARVRFRVRDPERVRELQQSLEDELV
jgi:hypothetical protein